MSATETGVRKPKTHVVKCWPEYFEVIRDGQKTFDLRIDDRDYQAGDDMVMEEFKVGIGTYTGRELRCRITYVARGGHFERFGLKQGYCCLAIKAMP